MFISFEVDILWPITKVLKAENDDLVKQLNILGVELEVSRIANQHSGELLQKEFDNQLVLRKELSFYQ